MTKVIKAGWCSSGCGVALRRCASLTKADQRALSKLNSLKWITKGTKRPATNDYFHS